MKLSRAVYDDIVAHAREGAPEEVCGVLGGEGREVTTVKRAENVAATPETRYELAPAEQLSLLRAIEDAGEEVVGFYHSHPRGPRAPSETDERLATWPDHVYLILALDGPEPWLGAWMWDGNAFVPEPVELS
ncbi:desampylase [Natronomonas sp. EA1]|uniref:desampylase n=1 Tax=Natronomonas sp. EA1 TaxID=3421655 RepID=UPI003EB8EF75